MIRTPSRSRWALAFACTCLIAGLLVCVATFVHFLAQGFLAWDAPTYLAAGERLNAGHNLYALGPGDRLVLLDPPYWNVPLLSPPPIAVLWRPLALLGNLGMLLWWAACIGSIATVVIVMSVRAPMLAGPVILVLSVPLAWELGSANVNGLLFPGFVATWLLARSGHDRAAGALVAVMTAVKVWPVLLVVWFVAQGRRSALAGFIGAGIVIAVASVLFAGFDANLRYLGIGTTIKPSPWSIAGILLGAGIDIPWVGYAIAAAAAIALFALRRFAGMTYAMAIAAIVVATPALYLNGFALLFTAISPFVWPALKHAVPPVPSAGGTHALVPPSLISGARPD